MPEMRNLLGGLVRHLDEHPDAIAFRTLEGETWTWREYADRAAAFAGGLARLGVGHADRIVIMLRNRLEFHRAGLGALLVGATPISMCTSSSPDQISYLVTHCKAVLAVTEAGDSLDRVLAADPPTLRSVVVVGDAPAGCVSYDEIAGGDPVDVRA